MSARCRPDIIDQPGQYETVYARSEEANAATGEAIVRVYLLPGGFRLSSAATSRSASRLRDVIRRAFGSSLLLIGVLGAPADGSSPGASSSASTT